MRNLMPLVASATVSVLVGVTCLSLSFAESHSEPRKEGSDVGRYQLVHVSDSRFMGIRLFVMDTATGQCWSQTLDREWRDEGNPVLGKAATRRKSSPKAEPTLTLPEDSVVMTINQREERAIPGSDGSLRIRLGDITEGQVHLELVDEDGDALLDRVSMARGDRVQFRIHGTTYAIRIEELRNVLVGDDFATLTIGVAEAKGEKQESKP